MYDMKININQCKSLFWNEIFLGLSMMLVSSLDNDGQTGTCNVAVTA